MLFTRLYQRVKQWAGHQYAPVILAVLSFAEASFFPIPPDAMLAPMTLANPKRGWWYATLTSLSSTFGGLFGYLIGALFISAIYPWIVKVGYQHGYDEVQLWFKTYGFWTLFVAGFSPLPYKLFTIAAGASHMAIVPFALASIIGRSLRFFLVSGVIIFGGERLDRLLLRYAEWIGWVLVLILLILFLKWLL